MKEYVHLETVGWQMRKSKILSSGKAKISLTPRSQAIMEAVWNSLFKTTLYLNPVGQVTEIHENIPYVHHCKIYCLIILNHIELIWINVSNYTILVSLSKQITALINQFD